MALVFRQTITTNTSEVYALYEAISAFLFRPLKSDCKVSPLEFLAGDPLKKVAGRLYRKYLKEESLQKWRTFSFQFSPQELLAIYLCIRNYLADPFLDVMLGKIQQRSLNLSNQIKL